MNAPPASPATTTRDGAFLAHVLAGALSLGLPDPDYITMHPRYARSATISAVDFQFNDQNGQEPLARMQEWAAKFGATVSVDTGDPASTWHEFDFTHAGVRFHAYAKIIAETCGAVAPHCGVTCVRPAGHNGFHESGHTPAIVWERAEVAWAKEAAAAVLAASVDAGTTVFTDDDEDDRPTALLACGDQLATDEVAVGDPVTCPRHGQTTVTGFIDDDRSDAAYTGGPGDPFDASISLRIAGGAS